MCARRFLFAIFIMVLLVVAGAFAIYQWGGSILLQQATPTGHFEAAKAGDGPDYARVESWIARPGLANNPSLWLPRSADGSTPANAGGSKTAATFFVHPTTYLERDRWNAGLDDADSQGRAALFVRSQASAFNAVSDIWAPKYRQAAYGAFLLKSDDANRALDLAYGDVARAFDRFLAEVDPGRPLILAAHSQGSLHLLRLIADRKDTLKGRLVAAYIVGWPVGLQADLPATGIPACSAPDQAGCVLSWQSFAEPANTSLVTGAWVGARGLAGIKRRREDMACTNPVNGLGDGASRADENPGVLVPNAALTEGHLEPGLVSARCDHGFLLLGVPIPAMGPYVLPGNNYHVYDYALFWAAVRRDAERRLAAWQKR